MLLESIFRNVFYNLDRSLSALSGIRRFFSSIMICASSANAGLALLLEFVMCTRYSNTSRSSSSTGVA